MEKNVALLSDVLRDPADSSRDPGMQLGSRDANPGMQAGSKDASRDLQALPRLWDKASKFTARLDSFSCKLQNSTNNFNKD